MRTRNRINLAKALNKMTLKDFKSPRERELSEELLKAVETADGEETTPRKRASKKGGLNQPVVSKTGETLTAKAGEGIVRKTTEEATASTKAVETEDVL
jgi:hypothetical protein